MTETQTDMSDSSELQISRATLEEEERVQEHLATHSADTYRREIQRLAVAETKQSDQADMFQPLGGPMSDGGATPCRREVARCAPSLDRAMAFPVRSFGNAPRRPSLHPWLRPGAGGGTRPRSGKPTEAAAVVACCG